MNPYCELGIGPFATQVLNTISNLAFFGAAYFSFRLLKKFSIKHRVIQALPFIFAVTGVGSILWHGVPNSLTKLSDILPLSLLILVSFFLLLERVLGSRKLAGGILLGFVLLETPFMAGMIPSMNGFLPYLAAFIFGLLLLFGVGRKYPMLSLWLMLVIVLFALAFFFRTVDNLICPTFPLGTHFLWHILNSLMFAAFIYVLARVEKEYSHKRA